MLDAAAQSRTGELALVALVVAQALVSVYNYAAGAYGGAVVAGVGTGLTFLFLMLLRR